MKNIAKIHIPAMLQTTIERLPRVDDEGLKTLGDNARRMLSPDDLAELLTAIEAEQAVRKTAALAIRAANVKRVAKPSASGKLAEQIERAFRAMPPNAAEVKRLATVHDNPGASEATLSELVGDGEPGAFNLAVSRMCQDRSSYLPAPAKAAKKREPLWSGILCSLVPKTDESGVEIVGWTLRPETTMAMRRIGLLP